MIHLFEKILFAILLANLGFFPHAYANVDLSHLLRCAGSQQIDRQALKYLLGKVPEAHEFDVWRQLPSSHPQTLSYFKDLAKTFGGVHRQDQLEVLQEFQNSTLEVFKANVSSNTSTEGVLAFEHIIKLIVQNDLASWQTYLNTALQHSQPSAFTRAVIVPMALESSPEVQNYILGTITKRYSGLNKEPTQTQDALLVDAPARTASFLAQWLLLNRQMKNVQTYTVQHYADYLEQANQVFQGDYTLEDIKIAVSAFQTFLKSRTVSPQPTNYFEIYGSFVTGRAQKGDTNKDISDIDIRSNVTYMAQLLGATNINLETESGHNQLVNLFKDRAGQILETLWLKHKNPKPIPPLSWVPELPPATKHDVNGPFQIIIGDNFVLLQVNQPPMAGEDSDSPNPLTKISIF